MFEALTEWFERRRALRELRAGDEEAGLGFGKFFAEQIEAATSALTRGDREWAFKTWREMNERYPKLSMTSERALSLLVELGGYDEADSLIREGGRRYPWHRIMFATVSVRAAQRRGDHDQTLRRCEILRRKFPRVTEGYTIAATCLAALDRQNDAEAVIEQAASRFPRNYVIIVTHARHAERRRDWSKALERWQVVRDRFDDFVGPVGMAQALREMGRYSEAREIATDVTERFPTNPWAHVELAKIAGVEADLEGAVQRWEIVREKFPDLAVGYTAGADAARRVGREVEADKILNLAVTRMRFNLDVHLEFARSAGRGGDKAAAAERWALVCDRFPDCAEARERNTEVLAAAERQVGRGGNA